MRKEELISKLNIPAEDVENASFYFDLKGIDLHNSIAEYLQSYKSEDVTYPEVATAYRYDKKIRKVLYKYIALLEEHIRAFISNKYTDDLESLELDKVIEKKVDNGMKLNNALDDILFSNLISQVKKLPKSDFSELFSDLDYRPRNLSALVELRNAVSHNRFLLSYMRFKPCYISDEVSASLNFNLINLRNHLSHNIGKEFTREILNCARTRKSTTIQAKRKYQVPWTLIKEVKVTL